MGMLTTIMHPMLTAMSGRDFRGFMEAFLRYARKAWFNYLWSLGMAIGPIVAIVLLWGDAGSTAFVLTAIGLAIVGVYIVANVWKEPPYDVMLALALVLGRPDLPLGAPVTASASSAAITEDSPRENRQALDDWITQGFTDRH